MALINISDEQRKSFFKLVTVDQFRKCALEQKVKPPILLKKLGKNYNTLDKKTLENYFQSYYMMPDDQLIQCMIDAADWAIGTKFKGFKQLTKITNGKSAKDLTDDDQEKIEALRPEFEQAKFAFSYEDLLAYLLAPTKEEVQDIRNEITESMIDDLTDALKDTEQKLKDLQSQKDQEKAEFDQKEKEYLTEIQKLKEQQRPAVQPETMKSSVGRVLGRDIIGMTYPEIYEELCKLEAEYMKTGNYDQMSYVLAAKFAVVKEMKGN